MVLAGVLLVLSLRRPVWALALYLMTFFAAPQLWWWGHELPSFRYAFWSGFVLLGSTLLWMMRSSADVERRFTVVNAAAVGMAINATFVHFVLAGAADYSVNGYIELTKFLLLTFLIGWSIQDKRDLKRVLISIALGAGYIGYEVTINHRGNFKGARLEGVGTPGADSSNGLACLMLTMLPLIGSLFVHAGKREKLLVAVVAPLALNVLIMCNSRGAFLGLIGAGLCFILLARGATRKQAIGAAALGGIALYFLLGDPDILNRFMTTFVGSEERDHSASSRLEFWQAGLRMLADHPLGSGFNAFKYVYGQKYISEVVGEDAESRSLHNGFLAEATDWGLQGLFLKLLFIAGALIPAYRTSARCRVQGDTRGSLIGISIIVAMVGFLIACMFGSFLNNEWGYWIVALLVRYSQLYQLHTSVVDVDVSKDKAPQVAA
jgi:O-antigen ligase